MSDQQKYYITTAISYPNGAPHIGHAYEIIATDALARFQKMDGKDVFFLTGTDVHGKKMKQSADAANMDIAEFAAKNSDKFRAMAEMLGCSHNDFIRTNQKRHHLASQEIWRRMQQNGDIYKGHYSGWYSVVDEAYYQENETQLIDGQRCGPSGTKVEWVAEESYFFRLSAYQQPLLDYYEANPDFIGPKERRNEVMAFVRSGLSDLSISRVNFGWGIEVPDDPAHSMYVWVDALTNYITGVGFPDDTDQKWYYWPADLHIIGKDIIRFHAVYWPAFLMSAKIALPARVYAHGHLLNSGEKMSKSLGNIVDPEELCQNFGRDGLRYFLLREVPFGQDGNYDHQAIIRRINADLANDLGNFAQRSLSMIQKNCQGILPQPGPFSQADEEILAKLDDVLTVCREHMARQAIHSVLAEIWSAVGAANRYFASQAPWTLRASDPERMGTILYVAAEILRQIALLALPVMPDSCNRLLDLLAQESKARSFAALGRNGRITAGSALPPPIVIFPRCEIPEDL